MYNVDVLAMKGGHVVIETTGSEITDYVFTGFIPHEDTVFTSLYIGDNDVSPGAVTYKAGIYYGAPADVGNGQYTKFTLASGSVVLVLSKNSPTHY